MHQRSVVMALIGLALVTVCGTACSGGSGFGQVASGSASATASSSSSVPSSSSAAVTVTAVPAKTVTVAAKPSAKRHVVTRVVQVPDAPVTSAALENVFNRAEVTDGGAYESDEGQGLFFDAPSQNIGCFLDDDGTVSCAIHDYDFPQPGPDCNAGIAALIDEGGSPSLTSCAGYFPVAHRGTVLGYGLALQDGDVGCVSEPYGISCLNTQTGTGFTISKQAFSPVY